MITIEATLAVPGDSWPIFVDVPRVDEQGGRFWDAIFPDTRPLYLTVQNRNDGGFWNGSATETPDASHWPTYAIPTTTSDSRSFSYSIPWSLIPEGQCIVRWYRQGGSMPSAADAIWYQHQVNNFDRHAPNPAGVRVTSDYGGIDALRVITPDGKPLHGVSVVATAHFAAGDAKKVETTTDAEGRWKFNVVLEPGRAHTITFTGAGYAVPPLQITPEPTT